MKPTLLILAAGMGSRYGSLKQIDKIGPSGETLMDYSIYDAIRAGIRKVVFVIKKDFEKEFIELIFNKYKNKIEVDYVFQELNKIPEFIDIPKERIKPWGTVHAVLMAEEKINENFIVINADDFYGLNSFKILVEYMNSSKSLNDFSMIGFPIENTLSENGSVSRGECIINKENYLINILEKQKIKKLENGKIISEENNEYVEMPQKTIVSMNIWGFSKNVFSKFNEYFLSFLQENKNNLKSELILTDAVAMMITSDFAKVKVLECNSQWFGITYKEDKPLVKNKLENLVNSGEYPLSLF